MAALLATGLFLQLYFFRHYPQPPLFGDPAGYYDGLHMTEDNATRLLLTMFHREHGCGH